MEMSQVVEIAKEAAERSNDIQTVLIFKDGTITPIMGDWSSERELWVAIDGKQTENEVLAHLIDAYTDSNGEPSLPPGYEKSSK